MVTSNKSITNTKRRRRQSSKQVVASFVDVINSRDGTADSRSACSSAVGRVDLLPQTSAISETPTSSSSTTKMIENVDMHQMIAVPESSNHKEVTNRRRSQRTPKAAVTKKARLTKPSVRSPGLHSTQAMDIATAADDVLASPLCVKKKMSRRALKSNQMAAPQFPNFNKKLPLMPVKEMIQVQEQSIGESKTTMSVEAKFKNICDNKNSEFNAVRQSNGIQLDNDSENVESKTTSSFHQDSGTCHHSIAGGCIGICDSIFTNESALFEISPDFWNRFLLDTYCQIASNNPDLPDLDPIPYQVLARGTSVAPENASGSNQGLLLSSIGNEAIHASLSLKQVNIIPYNKVKDPIDIEMQMPHVVDAEESTTNLNCPKESYPLVDRPTNNPRDDTKGDVGPDSWQMDVVNRMLFYLDCETNCPYSMYSAQFHSIIEHCTKLHFDGIPKCRHLPSAIFEQIVNAVGGSIFLSIYKAAKCLSYGRLDSNVAVVTEVSVDGPSAANNLIELAVGFGYCMARSKTFKGRKICPDLLTSHNLQYAVEVGAQTVVNMSNDTRLSFWNECILHNNDDL